MGRQVDLGWCVGWQPLERVKDDAANETLKGRKKKKLLGSFWATWAAILLDVQPILGGCLTNSNDSVQGRKCPNIIGLVLLRCTA